MPAFLQALKAKLGMGNLCGNGLSSGQGGGSGRTVAGTSDEERVFLEALAAARKEVAAAAAPGAPKFEDNYIVKRTLGKGAFAHVDLVEHKETKKLWAAKFLPKRLVNNHNKDGFALNICTYRRLRNEEAIVGLHEFYDDGDEYILVLEYVKGGMIFDHVFNKGHFGEREAADIMLSLLQLLARCHTLHIVHRDLKPENLLLADADDEHTLKVIDWHSAAWVPPGQRLKEVMGTPYYVAPEILRGDYNDKADIWSAGVIMYILLSGHPPFSGKTDEIILDKVREGKYSVDGEDWEQITPEAKDMLAHMLCLDDYQRWSAEQLLRHPWFSVSKTKAPTSLGVRLIHRLKNFVRLNRLKRLALVVIARTADDTDVQRLKEHLAANMSHEGMVDYAGMQRSLLTLGIHMDADSLQQLWKAADSKDLGEISIDEFIAAIIVSNRLAGHTNKYSGVSTTHMVRQSFDVLDHDHDGVISAEDLLYVLPKGTTLEEAHGMLLEVDPQARVDYKEFSDMLQPRELLQMMSMHSMLTGVRVRRNESCPKDLHKMGIEGTPEGEEEAAAAADEDGANGTSGKAAARQLSDTALDPSTVHLVPGTR